MTPSVAELEREVDRARARLNGSLSTLRKPEVVAQLKAEVWNEALRSKDELVRKATDALKDSAESVVENVKERALANPAAVLSIGAGLAFHVLRRPPISSLLVGLGIYGLFKTAPTGAPDGVVQQVRNQVDALADEAMQAAGAWGESAAHAIHEGADALSAKTAMVLDDARDRLAAAGEIVGEKSREAAQAISEGAQAISGKMATLGDQSVAAVSRLASDEAARDQMLLGVAAASVAAALAVSFTRGAQPGR